MGPRGTPPSPALRRLSNLYRPIRWRIVTCQRLTLSTTLAQFRGFVVRHLLCCKRMVHSKHYTKSCTHNAMPKLFCASSSERVHEQGGSRVELMVVCFDVEIRIRNVRQHLHKPSKGGGAGGGLAWSPPKLKRSLKTPAGRARDRPDALGPSPSRPL